MSFFEALFRTLGSRPPASAKDLDRLAEAWGLDEGMDETEHAGPMPDDPEGSIAYDRDRWDRRMKRALDELPASEAQWGDLMAEARALNLDAGWVADRQREEFALLVRRMVADGVFTGLEHRKLELARTLINIPEAEAEAVVRSIVAEAEAIFGKPVEEA